jgi:hypothetical protein
MNDDAAQRKHTRAVAYVRWRLASAKYDAIARAHADAAVNAEEVKRAAAEMRRRHAEWLEFIGQEPAEPRDPRRRNGIH